MTEWTEEQNSIFEAFPSDSNLEVDALAGTGKTTVNVEGIGRLDKDIDILACAFNKHIQTTLEKKLKDSTAVALTMNGMGHRAWAKYLGRRLILEQNKVGMITTEATKTIKDEDVWLPVIQLVAKAKTAGIVPEGAPESISSLMPDTRANWEHLAYQFDIDCSDTIIDIARMVLTHSIRKAFEGIIDFDDQIYMSTLWGAPFARYDKVVVDEAQDLNLLQHMMVQKSSRGQIIAVGDPRQAIYAFRGADQDSMAKLGKELDSKTYPLTMCWRCSNAVIDHVQEIVPMIRARNGAPEGSVSYLNEWNSEIFNQGDVILCRNNAPLLKLAFQLLREGKGVYVIGRDIGVTLKNLVRKVLDKNLDQSIETLVKCIRGWEQKELMMAESKGDQAKADRVQDKAEALRCAITYSRAPSPKEVVNQIDKLYSRGSAPITLSTIHKIKGMEHDTVYFLDAWLLKRDGDYTGQDENLDYVARSRAKLHLKYINSEDFDDGSE